MVPEPTNPYDSNAVRLEFPSVDKGENIMTGYVPAKISASVSAVLEVGEPYCEVVELNRDEKPWKQCKVVIREA